MILLHRWCDSGDQVQRKARSEKAVFYNANVHFVFTSPLINFTWGEFYGTIFLLSIRTYPDKFPTIKRFLIVDVFVSFCCMLSQSRANYGRDFCWMRNVKKHLWEEIGNIFSTFTEDLHSCHSFLYRRCHVFHVASECSILKKYRDALPDHSFGQSL